MEYTNIILLLILAAIIIVVAVICVINLSKTELNKKKTLNNEELRKHIPKTKDDLINKQNDPDKVNVIIDLFEDIEETIWEKIHQQFETNKFYKNLIVLLASTLLIFDLFSCVILNQNTLNNNLSFIYPLIVLISSILVCFFVFIYKSIENKMKRDYNTLIICSYQRTALLTAIQLSDKKMIDEILTQLSKIDQSFFNEKKSDFE